MKHNSKKQKNAPQYSKVLVLITGLVFAVSLAFCLTRDISNVYDVSLYTVAITVTGGVFGSAIIWYEKKAQAENVSKIQLQHIKDVAKVEFDVYEKKVRLQKELGIIGAPEVGMDDGGDFHVDEQMMEAVEQDGNFLNEKKNDAISEPEIQTH